MVRAHMGWVMWAGVGEVECDQSALDVDGVAPTGDPTASFRDGSRRSETTPAATAASSPIPALKAIATS